MDSIERYFAAAAASGFFVSVIGMFALLVR